MLKRIENDGKQVLITGYDRLPPYESCREVLTLHIWGDSPDAGDPECLCSVCLNRIPVEEVPIRWFVHRIPPTEKEPSQEIRLHNLCFRLAEGLLWGADIHTPLEEVLRG